MLSVGKKRKSVLSPSLLQSITEVFSQSLSESTQISAPVDTMETVPSSQTIISDIALVTTPVSTTQTISDPVSPVLTLKKEFEKPTPTRKRSSNFLKGCKWSPDGLCLLTNSDDNQLRLFEIPCDQLPSDQDLSAVLHLQEPELIYDFEWYPFMDSSQSETCFIVSSCRQNPVHLFDAYTGHVRASYKAMNHLEELITAYSLAFDLHTARLYCGYDRGLRAFDIQRPGPCIAKWDISDRKQDVYQSGIISCLAFNPNITGLYAAGSYARTIGIYGNQDGSLIALLHGHIGGLTHLRFSADGYRLYSGARKDGSILCWDTRNLGEFLCTFQRHVDTNQRIYFDFDSSFSILLTGNSDGRVFGWNLSNEKSAESMPDINFLAHYDCTNGISIHPKRDLFATSSGQRRFAGDVPLTINEDEDDENVNADFDISKIHRENCVKIWPLIKNGCAFVK